MHNADIGPLHSRRLVVVVDIVAVGSRGRGLIHGTLNDPRTVVLTWKTILYITVCYSMLQNKNVC